MAAYDKKGITLNGMHIYITFVTVDVLDKFFREEIKMRKLPRIFWNSHVSD